MSSKDLNQEEIVEGTEEPDDLEVEAAAEIQHDIDSGEIDIEGDEAAAQAKEEARAKAEEEAKVKAEEEAVRKANHEKARGFQKHISEILKAQIDELKSNDLETAFKMFYETVMAEEDLAEYMQKNQKAWVMLLNVIDKFQQDIRMKAVLDKVLPGNDITNQDIKKELVMIEQRQMEYMMEGYLQTAKLVKSLMEGAGKGGPAGGASFLAGLGLAGPGGIQVVDMSEVDDLGSILGPGGRKPS